MGVLPDCASGTFCSSKEKTNVRVKRAEEEKRIEIQNFLFRGKWRKGWWGLGGGVEICMWEELSLP